MPSIENLYLKLIPELQRLIISYGDPEISQKMKQIFRQINYYQKEFTYQRKHNKSGIFYNKNEYYFPYYVFTKTNQKDYIYPGGRKINLINSHHHIL